MNSNKQINRKLFPSSFHTEPIPAKIQYVPNANSSTEFAKLIIRSLDNLSKGVETLLRKTAPEQVTAKNDWIDQIVAEQKSKSNERINRYSIQIGRLAKRVFELQGYEKEEVWITARDEDRSVPKKPDKRIQTEPIKVKTAGPKKKPQIDEKRMEDESLVFQPATDVSCQIEDLVLVIFICVVTHIGFPTMFLLLLSLAKLIHL